MDDNCSLGAVFVKSASANRLVRHAGLLWREFRGSEYADSAPSVSPDLRANLSIAASRRIQVPDLRYSHGAAPAARRSAPRSPPPLDPRWRVSAVVFSPGQVGGLRRTDAPNVKFGFIGRHG